MIIPFYHTARQPSYLTHCPFHYVFVRFTSHVRGSPQIPLARIRAVSLTAVPHGDRKVAADAFFFLRTAQLLCVGALRRGSPSTSRSFWCRRHLLLPSNLHTQWVEGVVWLSLITRHCADRILNHVWCPRPFGETNTCIKQLESGDQCA